MKKYMYNNNNYHSSSRRGTPQRGFNRKPFSYGGFGSSRNSSSRSSNFRFNRGQGKRRSKLLGADASIFIKKTAEVSTEVAFKPRKSFAEFAISNPLKQNIAHKGFVNPTPIQDQAIDPILEGKDLIGLANTGTGKTAAFLVPTIDKIFKTRADKVLIITPTRELAVQINDEFRSLSAGMHIYSALVIGGANMYRQISDLRRNPHAVIGTPGRLKDLIEQKKLNLKDFSIVILDEVDLMVDIGFINDVKYFISLLPENRQSLFFSATISPKVREVLDAFVKNPVTVSVKQQDTAENVDQDVVRILNKDKKIDQLHDLLIRDGFDKVLVFGQTKHGIEKLHKDLTFRGFKVGAIHGNKKQGHRQRTLQSFKQNEIQILLATDVASRGLDIPDVTHVINYDLPETYEDYIHRIGRTGRAGKKGTALTFIGA